MLQPFYSIPKISISLVLPLFLFSCGGGGTSSDLVDPDVVDPEIDLPVTELPELEASSIQIEWLDNSDNEDGFMIERRISEVETFTAVGFSTEDVTSYTDTGSFVVGGNYCYRITAFNQAGVASADEVCIDIP